MIEELKRRQTLQKARYLESPEWSLASAIIDLDNVLDLLEKNIERCLACDESLGLYINGMRPIHECSRLDNCGDSRCPIGSTMAGWPHPTSLTGCIEERQGIDVKDWTLLTSRTQENGD
jgi:hypothetical protein